VLKIRKNVYNDPLRGVYCEEKRSKRFPDHVISSYSYLLSIPWPELALGVVSSASTKPHGAQSSPTPWVLI